MTKEQFKKRWESNDSGGGITFDDVADCAKDWGICENPMTGDMVSVLAKVLEACGIKDNRNE